MDGARELGIHISEPQISAFRVYIDELRLWGKTVNLIHRPDDREIILKDFIDSLTVVKYLPDRSSLLDLGSGAGFPGVPLKIIRADLDVVLLEATQKKVFFLKNLIRTLNLQGIRAIWKEEMETIRKEIGSFDYVVSRAVGSLSMLVEEGAPFLKSGGIILAMKGKRGEEELEKIQPFLSARRIDIRLREEIKLPILGHSRTIIELHLH